MQLVIWPWQLSQDNTSVIEPAMNLRNKLLKTVLISKFKISWTDQTFIFFFFFFHWDVISESLVDALQVFFHVKDQPLKAVLRQLPWSMSFECQLSWDTFKIIASHRTIGHFSGPPWIPKFVVTIQLEYLYLGEAGQRHDAVDSAQSSEQWVKMSIKEQLKFQWLSDRIRSMQLSYIWNDMRWAVSCVGDRSPTNVHACLTNAHVRESAMWPCDLGRKLKLAEATVLLSIQPDTHSCQSRSEKGSEDARFACIPMCRPS